jgi:hypothetical protein
LLAACFGKAPRTQHRRRAARSTVTAKIVKVF